MARQIALEVVLHMHDETPGVERVLANRQLERESCALATPLEIRSCDRRDAESTCEVLFAEIRMVDGGSATFQLFAIIAGRVHVPHDFQLPHLGLSARCYVTRDDVRLLQELFAHRVQKKTFFWGSAFYGVRAQRSAVWRLFGPKMSPIEAEQAVANGAIDSL